MLTKCVSICYLYTKNVTNNSQVLVTRATGQYLKTDIVILHWFIALVLRCRQWREWVAIFVKIRLRTPFSPMLTKQNGWMNTFLDIIIALMVNKLIKSPKLRVFQPLRKSGNSWRACIERFWFLPWQIAFRHSCAVPYRKACKHSGSSL